jgi:shikimate dehydrogenase
MRSIDGKTQIVAVIGDPIEHTLSPAMHNAAFEALGMNWSYIACHVLPDNVGGAVEAVRALGLRGMNVTVPHKQGVMTGLDSLSDAARAVGAVNTIVHTDGKLHGDNTDIVGIIRAITEGAGVDTPPERAVILGAGGAARGIVYALTTLGGVKHITVLNRTVAKASALADEFDGTGATTVIGAPLSADEARTAMTGEVLLINATSVGRGPLADSSPIDDRWECLHESVVCIDSNYSPPTTQLMMQVEAAGGRAYNGLDMLIYQGARSFELWTGHNAPIDVMKKAVLGAS